MPMAHNVAPATAGPVAGKRGVYSTVLELEMFGEWALAVDVDGRVLSTDERVRDKLIVKRHFGAEDAMSGSMQHEGKDHGGMQRQTEKK